MSGPRVIVGPGDFVATVPHVLGACPERSLVVFPTSYERARPLARVEVPDRNVEHAQVAHTLAASYSPFVGGQVVLIAFTDQLDRAASICGAVTDSLEPDNTVICQVAAHGDTWVRLDAQQSGTISEADQDRIAADFIANGRRQPYDSFEQLRASFNPCGEDLSGAVSAAAKISNTAGVRAATTAAEECWMAHAIVGFVTTGRPLASAMQRASLAMCRPCRYVITP